MSVTLRMLFVATAVALCTTQLMQGVEGRNIEVDWTPEGVRPYRNYRTPLKADLGDTLILRCGQNFSNLFIQPDQVQFDMCNANAGSGMFDYNGFCLPGGMLILTLTQNSQNLMNTVNFVDNTVYYLTSYSNGMLGVAANESINWGGQCDLGLRMIFVIGDVAPESLPTPTTAAPTPVVSRIPVGPVSNRNQDEDSNSHRTLIIIATTSAGLVVVIVIAVIITVLLIKVGYFNRLKNQSDPLSRHVAINIDSSTQDKGFYQLVKGADSKPGTPSPNHDGNSTKVEGQNLRAYSIQPVQRNYYVDSTHLPVSRMSSQQSEEENYQEEAQNDYDINSPSGPTSELDTREDYVNSPNLATSPECYEMETTSQIQYSHRVISPITEQEVPTQYNHHVTSPTLPSPKPVVSPRTSSRAPPQAKRRICVDSPSIHSISSLASQYSTNSEATVQRSFYADTRNLPSTTKPPPPQRSDRVMQLKRNFCIDSPSAACSPPTSRLTSPKEELPASSFQLDFSSSPSISSFLSQGSESVQQLKRKFYVDSPSLPTSRSSSPQNDKRKPYKKTGEYPSPISYTGYDSERSSPSPTLLSSQVQRTFEIINEHEADNFPVTFKPGMQAWRII